jgi:hypothetical protein
MTKSRHRRHGSAPQRVERLALPALLGVLVSLFCGSALAREPGALSRGAARARRPSGFVLERAVVRFAAPETGGARTPRFIFERVLAFEARLEALADPDRSQVDTEPYRERHVRAALERHVAETLLASLRVEPEPTPRELVRQSEAARAMLAERVGGAPALEHAARAEGIDSGEMRRLFRRQARASLYLDRMVAPMLRPSDAELYNLHRTAPTPFRALPYERAALPLRRWYVGRRLSAALASFYQNARSRLQIVVLD